MGSSPCCRKIASDQTRSPVRTSHSQNPVPDAASTSSRRSSRRSRSDAIVADLVHGHRQPIAGRAERGHQRRDDGAAREVQDDPGDVDRRQLEPGPVGPHEDRRIRDPGDDRRGQPAGQPADPGRDRDGAGQDDEAGLAAERGIQRCFHDDRQHARDDADQDAGPRPDGHAPEPGQVLARAAQGGPKRPRGVASLTVRCRQRRSSRCAMAGGVMDTTPAADTCLIPVRRPVATRLPAPSDYPRTSPSGSFRPAGLSSVEVPRT